MSDPVKTTSKDILARCMATEDITVRHSVSAETASFDTLNRVLTLPVWQDMDNALYDMLVGHEVSHALHTPADGWKTAVGEGPMSRMRHMFVNVVEDARIERLIKAQFPGLRRDFASAYASLHDRDLFEVKGKDLSDLPLIDRLNLEFKLGLFGLIDVPFSDDEKQYVTRMAETKTFEEVVALAHELFDMEQENMDDQQQEQMSEAGEDGEDGEDSDAGMPSESGEDGQSDDESGAGAGAESDEDGDESAAGGSEGDEDGTDSGQSMTDDTDNGESAESTEGDESSSGQQDNLSYDDYSNNPSAPGSTQNAFENGVSEMRDDSADEYEYRTLPTANLDKIVVDFTEIASLFTSEKYDTSRAVEGCKSYLNSIKPIVNSMVQQFQMKQAADSDKRTSVAKTGILDPVSMINYRWSEDIFLKNETVADGKNHGIVMYVDWSGSMCNILQDTVEQLLVLVEFCRKVNIPFEVYAFSSSLYCPHERYSEEYDEWCKNQPEQWKRESDSDCDPHVFQLYNWLSSRMNKQQYAAGVGNLWATTAGINDYSCPYPRCLCLGSTPLNEAVVCAMQQVPEFQNQNGVQIVSTVFLTDGEGHGMLGSCWGKQLHVTDKKTKKSYRVARRGRHGGETNALLDMLRDRTGSNLVGIRLHDAKNIKHLRWDLEDSDFEALSKQYKTENYITLDSAYDEYFLVKGDLKVETDALEDLDEDASYTRIKNAFIKGGNRKKTSRVIANRMVDIFAS
tara:strand:+ start:110 stop:2326 length:2217 start_codon:yes stop_codon:yes gene_type:complete